MLHGSGLGERLSRRAAAEIDEARNEFSWLSLKDTSVVADTGEERCCWWTFAGLRANAMLAESLRNLAPTGFDNLAIRFNRGMQASTLEDAVANIRDNPPKTAPISDRDRAVDELKFSACVPRDLLERMLAGRLSDTNAVDRVLAQPLRTVVTRAVSTN